MSADTMVKLKKVGNSQAVIIPSSFLKGVDKTHEIEMSIEANEIRLIFVESKTLQQMIDEKRNRNRGMISEMMKKIEKMDPQKFEKNYVIHSADDLID
ncbi:AbrB/MazE/SpoVT family DNA-binding domain-containing protein [Fluviicola taffensis]|uniref:SpoVT/AbrB domain-containing protein n=1 Tax=Fluviicola taffensis (strain DSM 16823 / NCIMB 13979 / RW262) TaxID=755732 RepID=F2IHI6_FLUTR|nr:AbrB/MazE/SpoVT family DNA-binding domain-containing protein [Fluviicola taffensis]AEA43751.1 SpoVT/AbrB domain-containing protein [Fluviicola taffensis DSM 16823]